MTHAFRKYLNKRGSALFMVLSLMTALMILVMAMYFSVISSRDVQYKVFYQEQAYRSASSLSDAIVAGLSGDSWQKAEGSDKLIDAITGLGIGETITTNSNGFAAFGGTEEEQDQLGAYTVNITRMNDETIDGKTTYVYDIAITTSAGGVLDTTHTYIHVEEPAEDKNKQPGLFASTGYVPSDVCLDGGVFYTDVFLDNENAIIGAYNEMQNKIYGNVYAGGSLKLNYIDGMSGMSESLNGVEIHAPQASTWAIRNNFTYSAAQTLNLGTSSERGLLLVGGDATFTNTLPKNVDIYVLGDAHFTANQSFGSSDNVRLFVYGDIVLDGYASNCKMPSVTYTGGYNNKLGKNPWDADNSRNFPEWKDNPSLPKDVMSSHDMAMLLDKLTSSADYPKWEINDHDAERTDYIPELDEKNDDYDPITINFNNSSNGVYTQYLDWNPKTISNYYDTGSSLTYTACVIEDVVNADSTNNAVNNLALVIDTGDAPDNQYIIKVLNNRDFDHDTKGVKESFSWYPYNEHNSAVDISVIVRGKGSVVIVIPDDVIYQDMDNVLFMHETWFAMLGGTIEYKDGTTREKLVYKPGDILSSKTAGNTAQYIHGGCDKNCSECSYKVTTGKCAECGAAQGLTEITCDEHDATCLFCASCGFGNDEPEYWEETKGGTVVKHYYGVCANRIERSAVKSKVATLSPNWQALLKASGDGSNWYYPNCNIFLVSCSESADIRLSTTVGGKTIMQNGFFGFIYAPYMTFKGYGNNAGGGFVRFCGGMNVSDYIIRDSMSFLTCRPDKLPLDLMSKTSRNTILDSFASKSWKISLAGY